MTCVCVHALGTDSEISQFSYSFDVEQDVGSFDISMYFFMLMEVEKSLEN